MDKAFFSAWFRGFEDGLGAMDAEARRRLLSCCAKRCADTGALQAYLQHRQNVGGDRDAYYRLLYELGIARGEVVVPGREYRVCFPECACDLHTACGVDTPLLCECSRQSVLYVAETVWPECDIRVENEGTVLSGAPECRFRVVFQ